MFTWIMLLWVAAAWDRDKKAQFAESQAFGATTLTPTSCLRAIRHAHVFEAGRCIGCAMARRVYTEQLSGVFEPSLCENPPVAYSEDMQRLLLVERVQQQTIQQLSAKWKAVYGDLAGFYEQPDIVQKVDAFERTVARLDVLEALVVQEDGRL